MNIEDFDFKRLIQPIDPDSFFAGYWEKKPLHIQRDDHDYYKHLLSQKDLDNLISNTDMRYPAIKLIQKGTDTPRTTPTYYPPETYTNNWKHGNDVYSGVPDVDKIYAEYRAGATINLPGLEQSWRPLWNLCVALESYFNHAVRVNGYITSENSQGFALHYDTHEVFVLQIAGKKRWHVYEPPLSLPLINQPFAAQPFARNYSPPPPLCEPHLEPGDLLYLPRGYVHSASTSDSFSAHVTIGVTVYTWVNLASEIFMSCMESPQFRAALPAGFASRAELKDIVRQRISGLLVEFQNDIDYDKLIDIFINRVLSSKLPAKGTFHCDASAR